MDRKDEAMVPGIDKQFPFELIPLLRRGRVHKCNEYAGHIQLAQGTSGRKQVMMNETTLQ